MEKIIALGKYTLIRKSGRNESSGIAVFKVNLKSNLQAEVSVNYENNNINTVIKDIQVSSGFSENIKKIKQFDFELVPETFKEDIYFISTNLGVATKKVISLIKYYLRHSYISETLIAEKGSKWGETIECPYELPMRTSISISSESSEPLRENTINNIQSALNSNLYPLLAMRHLHRAKSENIAHHKWIDATIAAELAIKEVLSKANPDLELLLMEMPSPPLVKLYGVILEKYLGEKSPYLKHIKNGVKIRNRLIHKPYDEKIDHQDANDYVTYIEAAIFHLLHKLYPNEPLIKNAYYKFTK